MRKGGPVEIGQPAALLSLRALRGILVAAGIIYAVLTLGFVTRSAWATDLWPWADTPLSYTFIGSVCGALAVGALWSGLSGQVKAVAGSLRGLVVIYGCVGAYLLARAVSGERAVLVHAVIALLTAAAALFLLVFLRRLPPAEGAMRRLEPVVRVSTAVFALALMLAGAALIARLPGIFPWPLSAPSSTVFGLIFLGLSLVYADVAWSGTRSAAIVAMSGFLVYDIILLPPFLAHFSRVPPELRTSLTIYVAVLIYSAVLAIWFLFRPQPAK